jgi:hypothetical protein
MATRSGWRIRPWLSRRATPHWIVDRLTGPDRARRARCPARPWHVNYASTPDAAQYITLGRAVSHSVPRSFFFSSFVVGFYSDRPSFLADFCGKQLFLARPSRVPTCAAPASNLNLRYDILPRVVSALPCFIVFPSPPPTSNDRIQHHRHQRRVLETRHGVRRQHSPCP